MNTKTQELSDEEIAKLVQGGDADAFAKIVKRYEKKMTRYANKFLLNNQDAEDIVQEVFLKAYINIQSFDVSRKFSSWLYRIAHNEFINAIKKRSKLPLNFFDSDTLFPHPVAEENPETDSQKRETKQLVEETLGKLGAKYREPLLLYYIEDLSYQEVADIMKIPIATVGVRIKRGKDMIRKILNK